MNSQIDEAVRLLKSGDVIGMPTETVYGLAACIDNPLALAKIFSIKERPFFDPLIVHVYNTQQAQQLTSDWNLIAQKLAQTFWPGPLTLVLPKSSNVNSLITSGLDTVGIRMPRHTITQKLLSAVGVPLAAPSANKFGKTSPTTADHVRSEFEDEKIFVLEGGASDIGIESTVLSIQKVKDEYELGLLRQGFVSKKDIENALKDLKIKWSFTDIINKSSSPGHMKHHYMPAVPLVLCRRTDLAKEKIIELINQQAKDLPTTSEGVRLPSFKNPITDFVEVKLSADPRLAAREFYAKLRELSQGQVQCLLFYLQDCHTGELWSALIDRIQKASIIHLD